MTTNPSLDPYEFATQVWTSESTHTIGDAIARRDNKIRRALLVELLEHMPVGTDGREVINFYLDKAES